ncbi:MAG TPA: hypothetical protein VLM80_12435, partial [Anaerolineales bacterium]|nr:hypothetical protein [Anaerolineales bacterium]
MTEVAEFGPYSQPMQTRYHVEITSQALEELFNQQALQVIIRANLAQDNLSGQIGHPEYHFDDNCFLEGNAYLREQRQHILESLHEQAAIPAWQAFGRLIHAAQDFYAHSTYVRLWFDLHPRNDSAPRPEEIQPLEPGLIHHPALISGRIYLPWEILSFIPGLEKLMCILLPQ